LNHYKIALVEAGNSSTHIFSRTYLPRLGIPTLGAVMKGRGYACDIWFQSLSEVSTERLREYDVVGIGSLTSTVPAAYRLADALRGTGPVVVMGGPHATFLPGEALEHCDYVVLGEGENTLPALVEALEKGEPVDGIRGLAYKLPAGGLAVTGPPGEVDFSALPSPDFSLGPQIRPGRIPPIITTSRGCPHECIFCSVTAVFGRKYRFKSSSQVISELRPVLGRSVCFGDDNFFANPRRTKRLLREMIDQNAVPLRWSGEMAVRSGLDEDLLDLMQATRCRIVYVGVESLENETLKSYGKAHQVEATGRCIENLHRRGIGIHGMFVAGMNDTPDTIEKIVDYAIETDIDSIQICSFTPFPGTQAFEEHGGRLLHRMWEYFDGVHVVAQPYRCSAYEMQMGIMDGLQRFYSLGRVLGAYRRGRGWRVKYRAGGHYLTKRWLLENRGYLMRLKAGFYPSQEQGELVPAQGTV
jgi:anaerobic magnesium-protoporphyrin IX monomethyl ester cyclase